MRRVTPTYPAALLGLAAVLLTGCTSSAGTARTPSSAGSSPVAPSTSVTSSATPSPTPTPTPTPLSPFEKDPGVQAFRAWAAEAARTVNTGADNSPALRRLMTSYFSSTMKNILGGDVGGYYPGPVPYQPLGVTVVSSKERRIKGCLLAQGWVLDKKTRKPLHARAVAPAGVQVVLQDGRWVMDDLYSKVAVSCKGIGVRTQQW